MKNIGILTMLTKEQREYIYGVVASGVPILALTSTQVAGVAQLIIGFAAALLGLGGGALALANTTDNTEK